MLERAAAGCYELGCDVGDADAFGFYGAQLVAIRWLQGRGGELLDLLDDLVDSTTVAEPLPAFIAARAALSAACGDELRARAALACLPRCRPRRAARVRAAGQQRWPPCARRHISSEMLTPPPRATGCWHRSPSCQ